MAAKSVNTTVTTLVESTQGMKSVLVQNLGEGGLWVDVRPGPNATVSQSTGVYVGIGQTVPVDVYQANLVAVSNGTADVRWC